MTDRPIPFSAPMVRALLDGRKTQTRRILKPQPGECDHSPWPDRSAPEWITKEGDTYCAVCGNGMRLANTKSGVAGINLRYAVGDRLWVREEYYQVGHWEAVPDRRTKGGRVKWQFVPDSDEIRFYTPAFFRCGRHHKDPATLAWHKRLGRFMPRRYSRTTLLVTGVKVERLQDINAEDARDEGVDRHSQKVRQMWLYGADQAGRDAIYLRACKWEFEDLWKAINGPESWDANPWVVAVAFTVHACNIDKMAKAA